MSFKTLFSPWKTHLFYWALLAVGYVYFQQQLSEQLRFQRALGACLNAAANAITRENERYLVEVERSADTYRHDIGEDFRNRARQVSRLVAEFQQATSPEKNNLPAFSQLRDSILPYVPEIEEIQQDLFHFVENDPFLLPPAVVRQLLKKAAPVDTAQLIAAQQLRAALVGRSLLRYYYVATMPDADIIYSRFLPMMSVRQIYPRAGKPFEADIFLSGYSPQQYNTNVTINGEPYPLADGLVKYRTTFSKPGNYLVTTQFNVKNPLTGTVQTYMRTFDIQVMP